MRGRAVRERRQVEAAERQTAREARTAKDQIELLNTRPGDALKERTRLSAGITVKQKVELVRRGRKAGLKKTDMTLMTDNALASAVVSAERARA